MKSIFFIGLILLQAAAFSQKKGQPLIDSLLNGLSAIKEDTNKVKSLTRIAETYVQVDPARGIGYAKNGLAIAEKLQWKKGIAKLDNAMGLLVGDTGNNTQARTWFEQSFALNKDLGDSFRMISNLNNIGRSYQRESEFPKALDYYLKALTIAEEIKNNEQIALVGTNLTASFVTQGDYRKGLEYAEMTLKYATLSNTPNNIGKALLQLGVIKMETKDSASSKTYMAKALKVYEEMDSKAGIAQVLVSMATLDYPDYKAAIAKMLKAQQILDEIGPSSIYSIGNMANLGSSYYDLALHGKPSDKKELLNKAETYLKRGILLSKETANTEYLANMSLSLSSIEEEKGNYKPALDNFKTYYSINDSLFSQDKKNELAGLESKHKIDLKDKEIAIGNLKLINQQRTLIGMVIGLALLSIIGGLVFRQSRMRKRSNTTLLRLNTQLDEANKTKLKFFGILSHDLRSPIANLVNYLFLLKNDPELLPADEQAAHQQQIGQSTEDLLQTLETMLLWSKEQMENFRPDIKIVPVSELFDYLQKFFSHTAQVNIRFKDPGTLEVSTDENYLKVIMQNLTSNAISAVRNTTDGLIEWKARKEDGRTILSITDNGPGINAEQAKALFEEGISLNAKTGFGFHLIRDLARAIRFQISIEPAPTTGATFVLSPLQSIIVHRS
jgi:signal transduction histidine kinase